MWHLLTGNSVRTMGLLCTMIRNRFQVKHKTIFWKLERPCAAIGFPFVPRIIAPFDAPLEEHSYSAMHLSLVAKNTTPSL